MQYRRGRDSLYKRILSLLGAIAPVLVGQIAQPVGAIDQIVEIRDGSASLQRDNRRRPAAVGTEIRTGDLVFPSRGAVVRVLCQNGTFGDRTRLFGLADVCPESSSRRYSQRGRGVDDFLAFLDGTFEYASQVAEGNPTLRWNSTAEAIAYRLQMWDCGQAVFNCTSVIWETTAEGAEIRYGGTALEPGRNYQLEVIPIAATTADDQAQAPTYLTLRRLDAAQTAAVQTTVAQLGAATVSATASAEAKALAFARVYLEVADPNTLPPHGVGLLLEAIPTLAAVAAESTTPYVHRLLGDLYLQVGLLAAAETAYETTLRLTTQSADLENRAAAQVGLANIAVTQGEHPQAAMWLQQSRVNYALLGEDPQKDQVEQWIDKLSL